MDWIERLNSAINYIEEHLTEAVEYEQLGRIAGCSTYHFQRMFGYMAGVNLSEYIRRRKMSLAAVDLQGTDAKIIDIALKYGYSSPTAFNRAFQSVHGIAPSAAKSDGARFKSFPRLVFQITIKGAEEMNYRIEQKEAFRIVGVSAPLNKDIEKNFEVLPKAWQKAHMDGTIPKLVGMMNTDIKGVLGVCTYEDGEPWKYFISVASTSDVSARENENLEEYEVSAGTWAVFSGEGDGGAIQKLEQRIATEWIPNSGYEYDMELNVEVEVYLDSNPQDMRFEVWVPVVKK